MDWRAILSTVLQIYRTYCICGVFFVVSMLLSQRNFRPLLKLAAAVFVIFTPFWTLTALDHISEAFDKTSAQWRVWKSIHFGFLFGITTLVASLAYFYFAWRTRTSRWPWAIAALGSVVGFAIMLAVVEGYGKEEFDYLMALPALSKRAFKLYVRTAPRAIYRYMQTEKPIDGSVLSWWVNDLLDGAIRRDEL